jgi:hypothetical protein
MAEPVERLTASQRLAVALGRPIPPPPTEEQIRAYEAANAKAEAEAERLYGGGADRSPT